MGNEKFDEKEMEKREEKGPDEKWRRDPLSAIVWAAIFIWAGLVLLAANLGFVDTLRRGLESVLGEVAGDFTSWSLILLGAGFIVLLEVLVRLLIPAYRRPIMGSLILGLILVGIGLSDIFSSGIIWALILIAGGVILLLRGFFR